MKKNIYIGIFLLVVTFSFGFLSAFLTKTKVIYFSPFVNGKLKSKYSISQTYKNSPTIGCMSSIFSFNKNIWRCFAQNGVFDPCYQQNDNSVICLDSPWEKNVTNIQSPKPLKREQTSIPKDYEPLPWALVLDDDSRCVLLGGATWGADGMRANYTCDNKTYLYGDINKSKRIWEIKQMQQKKLVSVPIFIVYK